MTGFDETMAAFDRDHLWHPYSAMRAADAVLPVVSARGVHLQLADGRQLVDGMSSWWAAIHGYNHPRINAAVARQLGHMAHVMFGGLTHPAAVELGRKLCAILPKGLDKVFFCDSGSVSVEVAVKMALQYWRAMGEPRKTRLLALRCGYHGDTFAAMSVCDPAGGMHHLFRGTLPEQIFARAPRCGRDCDDEAVADLERKLEAHAHETAAMIVEPVVQGAGGMRIYGAGYLAHARRLCDRHGVLLIFDEIATGFGRTGKMFALEHAQAGAGEGEGVCPDVLCVGKALSAGYLSLAATITGARVSDALDAGEPGVLMHGPTYMANPLACAAACASLELLARDEWRAQVARIERLLAEGLAPCRPLAGVRDVRVLGAVGVVELAEEVDVGACCRAFAERGVWIRPFRNLVYLMPPYVIGDDELAQLTDAVRRIAADPPARVTGRSG